jgi:hypothetical protein
LEIIETQKKIKMKALLSELESKGFCILDNIFTNAELSDFKKKFTGCEKEVQRICEVGFINQA